MTTDPISELNLAWQNPEGKVNAKFSVRIRHRTEPPSVLKYLVRVTGFTAARWSTNECDNCSTELQTELPDQIQTQISNLLGKTLYIPLAILDNHLTFYIDPPQL